MDDLISRQAAIDALKHNQDVYSHNFHDDPIDKYTTAIIAADIDSLVNLPSAQPERIRGKRHGITTCGECVHLHDNDCPMLCGRQLDDFCSWAEREGEDETD